VGCAIYVMNRTPLDEKNYGFPYQALYKKILQIKHLKLVGHKASFYAGNKDKFGLKE
jgi:hypothetical protein